MGQVRLDPEVQAEIDRRRALSGRTAASEVNAYLRRALGISPGQQTDAARSHLVASASISPANGAGPRPRPRPRL